jgi:hypothetical protein
VISADSFDIPAEGATGLALVLLQAALLGRALLSFLPPGSPGSHALRDLPATWAASHLLGSTVWLALFVWMPWFHTEHAVVAGFGLAAALALVRAATLPAALVPRHEPPFDRGEAVANVLRPAAFVLVSSTCYAAFVGSSHHGDAFTGIVYADALAAMALLAYGLTQARALPWMRATAMLVFAVAIALRGIQEMRGLGLVSALSFAAGAAFTIPWLRRADKRALFLAAIAFASAAPYSTSGWTCTATGLAWLVAGTAGPSRVFAASVALAFGAIGGALAWLAAHAQPSPWVSAPIQASPTSTELSQAFALLLFGVVFTARWLDRRDRRRRAPTTSGAPYAHEDTILLRMTTSSLFLGFIVQLQWSTPGDPLLPAMLILALLAGMSFKRFDPATSSR